MEIGEDYSGMGETGRAAEYFAKAFQLRDHATERAKLAITAAYYLNASGELDKAAQAFEEEIAEYPAQCEGCVDLGIIYCAEGQYDKAIEITRRALQLDPNRVPPYDNLSAFYLASQRFTDAKQIVQDAFARNLDDPQLHSTLYALAFLQNKPDALAEQLHWFEANPPATNIGLSLASDTEAYAGHLAKARELTRKAVDSAIQTDNRENAAIWQAMAAQREAAFGYEAEAGRAAAEALKINPTSQPAKSESALAFALAGEAARAEILAQELDKAAPLNTQMQSLWLPVLRAQVELARGNGQSAVHTIEMASQVEFGAIFFGENLSCLYPAYTRGSGLSRCRTGERSHCGVPKSSNSRWTGLELLDRCFGASWSRPGECGAGKSLPGCGRRCRPRSGAVCLQRFSDVVERCRSGHSDFEASQSRVREVAVSTANFQMRKLATVWPDRPFWKLGTRELTTKYQIRGMPAMAAAPAIA